MFSEPKAMDLHRGFSSSVLDLYRKAIEYLEKPLFLDLWMPEIVTSWSISHASRAAVDDQTGKTDEPVYGVNILRSCKLLVRF